MKKDLCRFITTFEFLNLGHTYRYPHNGFLRLEHKVTRKINLISNKLKKKVQNLRGSQVDKLWGRTP